MTWRNTEEYAKAANRVGGLAKFPGNERVGSFPAARATLAGSAGTGGSVFDNNPCAQLFGRSNISARGFAELGCDDVVRGFPSAS